jgi:fructan beta-fructosidase
MRPLFPDRILWLFLLLVAFSCRQASQVPVEQQATTQRAYYQEQHRPQFHFSPEKMWMNDPNGLVYFDGEYHLFYQHYPDSTVWGPMHWGHAVSTDLLHWQHLPIALFPDSLGYIFSGSAVVDWNNTSGLGKNNQPPLVAIFTYHLMEGEKAGRQDFQYQGIAYSHDRGRTWFKYEGNPVIPNQGIRDFRDPKVFWHDASKHWVMVLSMGTQVGIFTSPDLKKWELASKFGQQEGAHGGVWECPDLFEININGTAEKRWAMLVSINPGGPNGGSATQYFIGSFDGKTFENSNTPETTLWLDYGRDNYAGVTWSDLPKEDGRRLFIGWMSNWDYAQAVPTQSWRSAMTLPRELILRNTASGLRLTSMPARELRSLRQLTYTADLEKLNGEIDLSDKLQFKPSAMEVLLEVEWLGEEKPEFGIELSNAAGEYYRLGYDGQENQYFSDRRQAGNLAFSNKFAAQLHKAPRLDGSRSFYLQFFFDKASAELFADWGATVITDVYFPSTDFERIKLFSRKGELAIKKAEFYALDSVWQ